MYFPSGPSPTRFVRMPSSRHQERGPIYAVGHRVLIATAPGERSPVTLMDALATVAHGTVAHGEAVEILAWQPSGPHGTRYRVRSSRDGVEGWLNGHQLKACERPPAAARVAAVVAPMKRTRTLKKAKPATQRAAAAK